MTGRATLPAFVSQVCQTLASFERPMLDLRRSLLTVSSAHDAKVDTVIRLAWAAGLIVSRPMRINGRTACDICAPLLRHPLLLMAGREVVQVVASPLGILDVRRRADLAGFGYETMAGWRPIATFDAYGMAPPDGETPAGLNWGPKWRPYACELVRLSDGSLMLRDLPDPAFPSHGHPFVLGGFPVAELMTECPGCGYALETPVPADDGNPCPCQYADNEGYRGEL